MLVIAPMALFTGATVVGDRSSPHKTQQLSSNHSHHRSSSRLEYSRLQHPGAERELGGLQSSLDGDAADQNADGERGNSSDRNSEIRHENGGVSPTEYLLLHSDDGMGTRVNRVTPNVEHIEARRERGDQTQVLGAALVGQTQELSNIVCGDERDGCEADVFNAQSRREAEWVGAQELGESLQRRQFGLREVVQQLDFYHLWVSFALTAVAGLYIAGEPAMMPFKSPLFSC